MCSFFCSIKSIFDPLHCYLELLIVQGKNDSKPTKFSATKLRSRNKVDLVLVKQLLEQIHLSFPGDCLQVHTEVSPNKKTSLNQNRMSFDKFFMSWFLDAIAFHWDISHLSVCNTTVFKHADKNSCQFENWSLLFNC